MIGFYNYTVILTYMSLLSAMTGMALAIGGHFRLAVCCLALSGLFDMFDGKVARSKKDRTDDEKLFGIQLDSLCDVVAFGAFPCVLCYCMGVRGCFGFLVMGLYCVCGVIRLAYFNVLETNQFFSGEVHEKVYHGLPITSIAVILPLVFLLSFAVSPRGFRLIQEAMLFVTGVLFIVDFRMKKPGNRTLALLVVVVAAAIVVTFAYSRFRMMHPVMM